MPNSKRSTRPDRRYTKVTVAFQRTFQEGEICGIPMHGYTRQVSRDEAKQLIARGRGWGQDGDGNLALDQYFRVSGVGACPLVLEKEDLIRENFTLTRMVRRLGRGIIA
jgi:hypothetical protein